MRAALEALTAAHPAWVAQRICVPDFARRYATADDLLAAARLPRPGAMSWRSPTPGTGTRCWRRCYDSSSPGWLREIPAVDVLRRVLVQNYTRVITADGREVVKRREKNLRATVSRTAICGSPPPMTSMPGQASSGRSFSCWATSCTCPRPRRSPALQLPPRQASQPVSGDEPGRSSPDEPEA